MNELDIKKDIAPIIQQKKLIYIGHWAGLINGSRQISIHSAPWKDAGNSSRWSTWIDNIGEDSDQLGT